LQDHKSLLLKPNIQIVAICLRLAHIFYREFMVYWQICGLQTVGLANICRNRLVYNTIFCHGWQMQMSFIVA